MNFNQDPSKLAQEIIFTLKSKEISHPPEFFNNIQIPQSSSQKHRGTILEEQLTFCEHLKMLTSKINKTIWHLLKLQNFFKYKFMI